MNSAGWETNPEPFFQFPFLKSISRFPGPEADIKSRAETERNQKNKLDCGPTELLLSHSMAPFEESLKQHKKPEASPFFNSPPLLALKVLGHEID